jgi:hypothetical protein
MALTDAQMTDVRRYGGYALAGTTMPITISQDVVYMTFGMVQMSLYQRLTSLSPTEETVLTTYLTQLSAMEQEIVGTGANLDTAQASVWVHNKNELADRNALFDQWRRRMCDFIGLPPGPGLGSGALRISRC